MTFLTYRIRNVALPKIQFAKYVLESHKGFDGFDFSGFANLFESMLRIGLEE